MKRFYQAAIAAPAAGGWQVMLDGRGVKTQGARAQVVPGEALAKALASEWAAQKGKMDPANFVLRDMADYALDVVETDREAAIKALLPYAETDTLCYRAEKGEVLYRRQTELWEPLLGAAEHRWDIAFTRTSGIMHRSQPPATLARLQAVLEAQDSFTLAALRSLSGLSASLIVALAAIEPGADPEALWSAANLEEDFQAELWGQDAEAITLRARRFRDFSGAIDFVRLART
ncbi:MAG: ATP12 family protein [Novosphingobium sp.]